jgi:hypothetical protein
MQVGQWHKQQGGEWYEGEIQSYHGFLRTCFTNVLIHIRQMHVIRILYNLGCELTNILPSKKNVSLYSYRYALCEDLFYHFTMNICQAVIAPNMAPS